MSAFLKRRLPETKEIFLALSMATFLVFSWSLRSLFYNVPALLLSFLPGDILFIIAYMFAFALLESLAVTVGMLSLAVVLPGVILKDGFAYKASYFFIAMGILSVYLQFVMNNQPRINFLLIEIGKALAGWLAAVALTRYVPPVQKIILELLDRITIFSYIYLPLGLISLFIVIFRNLW